ncbi:MAG TPA: hypothetical protein VF844_19015 [Ktedonobacteraceae bacterium]
MRFSSRSKLSIAFSLLALVTVVAGFSVAGALRAATSSARAAAAHAHINCAAGAITCSEVWDSEAVFGEGNYIGHDEPSTLFYSNVAGSGNQMRYQLTLPSDPSPLNPTMAGKSFNFELHPAFWFGMAMCDTQSYPEQVSTCSPDSDTNIVDPAISPKHPGTAFMEMQFYPPGWVSWPAGNSCAATSWCAALNIDSLSENPVTGQFNNATCAGIAGLEYVNFAFITKNGVPQPNSPPNPVNATINTFTPDPNADLFMNSGDNLTVTMHDTPVGLQIVINDLTSGQSGSMTTSKANGFGQVQFDPTGTSCNNIPYSFHPMYSTSSEKTRVPWAAHSYNIAFSDEIGHFDLCTRVSFSGTCTGLEGIRNDQEPADGDDLNCFPSSASTLVKVRGCANFAAVNQGFDGVPYQPLWPDGNTSLRPTPIRFSSPLTGGSYNLQYGRVAFEADLPRIENPAVCDRFTGVGCTLIPSTDDPALGGTGFEPAAFYPFFSIANSGGQCVWQLGNHIPGSIADFHQNQQYGTLLNLTYTAFGGGGAPTTRYNDFRQIFSGNPCKAS